MINDFDKTYAKAPKLFFNMQKKAKMQCIMQKNSKRWRNFAKIFPSKIFFCPFRQLNLTFTAWKWNENDDVRVEFKRFCVFLLPTFQPLPLPKKVQETPIEPRKILKRTSKEGEKEQKAPSVFSFFFFVSSFFFFSFVSFLRFFLSSTTKLVFCYKLYLRLFFVRNVLNKCLTYFSFKILAKVFAKIFVRCCSPPLIGIWKRAKRPGPFWFLPNILELRWRIRNLRTNWKRTKIFFASIASKFVSSAPRWPEKAVWFSRWWLENRRWLRNPAAEFQPFYGMHCRNWRWNCGIFRAFMYCSKNLYWTSTFSHT